ncbi:MAG: hypothetical protein HOV80_38865 [Polyangiaceae bacterium]|nr:hypothetical protein [Polyangiaceae bacterium]
MPLLRFASLSLLTGTVACGAAGAIPASDDGEEAVATGAVRSTDAPDPSCPSKPWVLHLGAEVRSDIEQAMKKGVTAVAFDCENVRVLECQVDDKGYRFVGHAKREEVVREASKDQTFEGKVVTVGEMVTDRTQASATDLKGACQGATHFIRAATVGAFAMELHVNTPSGEKASAVKDGDLAACDAATADATSPPAQCRALARLELVPIARE